MGINPNSGDGVEKNYTVDGRTDATSIVSDAEHTGNEAGKAFAQIAAQADSANKGTSDLSKRVAALEKQSTSPDLTGYPLLLWWDGTGTKPALKPGWALINITTGKVEKG
ncbi:hypothetical protein [Corynebacterium sp. ACRPQ]|uniref:hypothetical protein n=1 Tax=Corynebacterium sp. ACRPQ TaxID=2918201 RepID=UPI001EF37265|nr:hypothetical protein [Corynebacterium sp. ACRPQ]MCG7440668.1 hypothetical protein [Corynebacterium sp. ACRPQ]